MLRRRWLFLLGDTMTTINEAEHLAVAQAIANAHARTDTADPSGWMERAMEIIVGFDALQALRGATPGTVVCDPGSADLGEHHETHVKPRKGGRKAHAAAHDPAPAPESDAESAAS